ncbi:MAG TPA: hypothetical protein VNQ90_00325 [Chthoniobacteraceae bacterium]|nr:hypothetical protein [Chthoniobacteraceae bacterium]
MPNLRLPDFGRLRYRYRGRRKGPALVLGAFLFLVGIKLKLPVLFGLLLAGVGALIGYFFSSYVIVAGIALACLSAAVLVTALLYWIYRFLGGAGGSTSASIAALGLARTLHRSDARLQRKQR